jgi:cytochrome b
MKLYAIEESKGPLANTQTQTLIPSAEAHEAGEHANGAEAPGEETWEEIHEVAVNITLGLIVLHIAGVIISSRLHRESLVKAMITGNKNTEE